MIPKYRAYDKQTGQIFKITELYFDGSGVRACRIFGQTSKSQYKKSDFMYKERFELMQSTGLKDKNGVEIYEGDIVKTHTTLYSMDSFEDGWLFEVQWCPGNGRTIGWWLYGIGEFDANFPIDYEDVAMNEFASTDFTVEMINPAFEVIGNIYQHPELLKEPK